MMMTIAEFDQMAPDKKKELLAECCGSDAWIKRMLRIFPVQNLVDLLEYAEDEWFDCSPADWLEAFEKHPGVGDPKTIEWPFQKEWSIPNFSKKLIEKFLKAIQSYEKIFGYHFIIAANEKSTHEVFDILLERMNNNPNEELLIAASEQNKITQMKLQKLFR